MLKHHFLAFTVVAIWGITFISTKILINSGLLPSQIFFIRFIIAYTGIWLMCLGRKENRRFFSASFRDELIFLLLGVTGGSVYFLAENTALACTQACNVSFIVCSAPLITAVLTILSKRFLRGNLVDGLENVSVKWPLVVGTLLCFCGMAAVFFDGNALHLSVKGDLLAFGAALCWGVYSVFMSQMTSSYGTLLATRKVFFYGLVTILPFLMGERMDFSCLLSFQVWGNLLFLSVVASLLCFVVWNKVMAKLGNVTSTNYVYLNPFFTLVFAVIILGERLTFQSATGCAAIVAGVILGGIRR